MARQASGAAVPRRASPTLAGDPDERDLSTVPILLVSEIRDACRVAGERGAEVVYSGRL